jgi:hypothetical protein
MSDSDGDDSSHGPCPSSPRKWLELLQDERKAEVNLLLGSIPTGEFIGTFLTLRVPNAALRGCPAFTPLAIGIRLFRL